MRIVMVGDLYDESMQYQENLLAKYYGKHGHDVTMVASTFDNAFDYQAGRYNRRAPAREYWDGQTKVVKLPYSINIANRLRRFGGVRAILEREKPELIFIHDIHLNLADAVSYRRLNPGCRIIMDYHADFSNSGRNRLSLLLFHRLTRKRLLERCQAFIDKICPVVPAGADFLHQVYGVPYDAMTLLPLGADTDLAAETRAARVGAAVRRTMGISEHSLVIFTGGKLTPAKRTHLLLDAFFLVNDPTLHIVIVGDVGAADRAYGRLLVRAARANARVHFVGWVAGTEVYRYMDACDFAVFPASQSALWQQALSMGLPLIVGRVGVADPSYMNLYDNMIVLDEAEITAEAIAAQIQQVSSDRSALATRQASALRVGDELLNYHRLVEETLRVR